MRLLGDSKIMEFAVGDKVRFGRKGGMQTLGEVVKVNPKKLKVKTLEDRGNGRGSIVGALWTVPPSLCVKVDGDTTPAPVPTPVSAPARLEMDPATFARYAKFLGLPEDCLGKKIKIDRQEVTITGLAMNRPKFPVQIQGSKGGRYVATVQMVLDGLNAPATPVPATAASPYPANTKVKVKSLFGKDKWEFGVVRSNVMTDGRIRVLTSRGELTPRLEDTRFCPKMSEDEIMAGIFECYNGLSPENLCCDGEASRAHVRKRGNELNFFLRTMFAEIGREVSEEEAYKWWDQKGCPRW